MHNCGVIACQSLVEKKDPRAFTTPCTIMYFKFAWSLSDLRASINLMSLVVCQQLGLETPKKTSMRLLIKDHTVKKLIGILYDVLVNVSS